MHCAVLHTTTDDVIKPTVDIVINEHDNDNVLPVKTVDIKNNPESINSGSTNNTKSTVDTSIKVVEPKTGINTETAIGKYSLNWCYEYTAWLLSNLVAFVSTTLAALHRCQ